MKAVRDPSQTIQRVKVGTIGLVAVVLLIAVASAIIGSATRERPIASAGGAQANLVANIASVDGNASGEPLAELGVAPSATNTAQP